MTLTLETLEKLIGFNSVSARSNLDIISFIEDFLQTRGFRLTRIPDASGQKAGLFAEIGPSEGGVLLSGHTDVVPTEGQNWTKDPFRLSREEDRVYGRGTTDMKGYLSAMLTVADAAASRDLKEPLKLVFSYDEEIGCVGIQHMLPALKPLLGAPRMCLVGEPTEMQVAVGHKGKAAIRARCFGQNGHSALAPMFVNALHLATDFVAELRHIQAEYAQNGSQDAAYSIPYTTLHVGKLSGGMALNIVPDSAEVVFEYRHLATDDPENIMDRIARAAEAIARKYRPDFAQADIVLDRYNAYPGLDVSQDARIAGIAQRLAENQSITKVAFGTEAGFFSNLGIETVVCGPGSMAGQGHKPDEYITLDQLDACDRMLMRTLDEISQ
ncbi:acetylornithine deacetylase [Shimia thalassica]|uniref:acetylornithine deacetylase n=1 Tax=Shimia thalassica TaxID=1715693 RepID=UPI0026E33A32|nr:acetylornithine deacetylase [Shimia thalassica]MDO6520374.1 acetylornithine deacetylase [Shimia thalassica]